jgi:hypothetical protein
MPVLDDLEEFWKVVRPVRLPPRVVASQPIREGSVFVGARYQGHALNYLGLVEVRIPEPRMLTAEEAIGLMRTQDEVPIGDEVYVIEGDFFQDQYCTVDQFGVYLTQMGTDLVAIQNVANRVDIAPPLGLKFKVAVRSL